MRTWLAIGALVALLVVLLGLLVRDGEDAAPEARTPVMTVREVHGDVMRVDASGPEQASAGDGLELGDRVATGADGRAVIVPGDLGADAAPIRLAPSTAVRVVAADGGALELELERGQVKARLRSDNTTLRVSNAARAVTARRGAFAVRVDEQGLFSAEAEEGVLAVEGVPGVSTVSPGERVVSWPDGRGARTAVSADPLLDVRWPSATTQKQVTLVGTADPGARVRVTSPIASPPVLVGPDGQFSVVVSLAEGKNTLELEVIDPADHVRHATGEVTRDSTSPTLKISLDYGKR